MNEIRTLIRGVYDIQKLRIQIGNRLVVNYKTRLGQPPGMKERDALSKEACDILDAMRQEYKTLADAVADSKDTITLHPSSSAVIASIAERALFMEYLRLEESERALFKAVLKILASQPIWRDYLSTVRGIGPAMGGVIISEIDIRKARYPSSIWRYAGLDVAADGLGRSRKAQHLVDIEYLDKDGNAARKKSITFNPFLKTKLMGVLAASFLRSRSEYAEVYGNYKHRLENDATWKERPKLHRHNAALRYMIKMFLIDLYTAWRKIEGLPVAPTYQEAKLEVVHATSQQNLETQNLEACQEN